LFLSSPEADIRIIGPPDANGCRTLIVEPRQSSLFVPRRRVLTRYPDELIRLIFSVKKASYLCDEIAREEDPSYVTSSLESGLYAFFRPEQFRGKRVLDFGCGSGASTVVLNRLLIGAEIYGVELDTRLLQIAKARAVHYGLAADRLFASPDPHTLPPGLGTFDMVVLSAVWEHLLPSERPEVLKQIWSLLRPGGFFFLNQTPHRFTPVETHTTGLPLINYLPDRLALSFARSFSKRVDRHETWEALLRQGIRGGTENEVAGIITTSCAGKATVLRPRAQDGIRDRIDIWYTESSRARLPAIKLSMRVLFKLVKAVTGAQITPELILAVEKLS
jgi:2-polyprenyl-3-methyl-5-hydroxy-6-metoxy-1,4-benzoquinol methylase